MSYSFVRTIVEDRNGFMWFGSSEGLSRFDGHNSLTFHHNESVDNSLSSDVISRMIIDEHGRLWVGTFGGGVNLYQEETQTFLRFTSKDKKNKLTNDTVNAVFEDSEGKVWVGTEHGLNIITKIGKEWHVKGILQELGNPSSLNHNTIHSIVEVNDGNIWVGTNGGGISVFNLDGQFLRTVQYDNKGKSTYVNKFTNSLFVDRDENVWIGTKNEGLIKYDQQLKEFSHFTFQEGNNSTLTSNSIIQVYQGSQGKIWVATDNGLSIYDNDSFQRYRHLANNPYSLSSDYIITFFEDSNNIMWIGTFSGVNRWDPNMQTFRQYSMQTNPEIKNFNITSFAQFSEKYVLFSSYSGDIYQLSLIDNSIELAPFSEKFSKYRVMSLLADGNTLWIGTRASGLFSFDFITKKIRSFKHDANDINSLSANSVTDIIKDSKGRIWVSTFHGGLNNLKESGSFHRYTKAENKPEQGPSVNNILQLLEDEQGFIWLATFGGGLNRFDVDAESFIHIKHNDMNSKSLSTDLAWIMAFDNEQNLWVGTQAAGLNILSSEDRKNEVFNFRHLETKDGMKSMTVYGIVQDIENNIWLSTSKGISRYSISKREFKHFDLVHGLVDLEFTHSAIFLSENETLYFGSGKGFNSINPERIDEKLNAPKVRLTNILKLNESILPETSLAKLNSLELNYHDQLISFEYVGLNYADPESTRYKYRLLGFEQQWLDAGKSRRATYTNLPAGDYQLQIIAGNGDGVWSEPGLSLDIVVKPAPWNTWWAYILYTLVIALSLLLYSRLLNRKLAIEQQQKHELERQVREKTEKFRTQNLELAQANKQLEAAATIDKLTGVKSRRYLDIYIEQTSQLMNQMHHNLPSVQRSTLPRLYILMIQVSDPAQVTDSKMVNLSDLLLYTRNNDDLVVRWSENTFAVIGYEKDNNASELVSRLSRRFNDIIDDSSVALAYSFYPFSRENPLELSWDQMSVLLEQSLSFVVENNQLSWLGLCGPKVNTIDYLQLIKASSLNNLKEQVIVKSGLM